MSPIDKAAFRRDAETDLLSSAGSEFLGVGHYELFC